MSGKSGPRIDWSRCEGSDPKLPDLGGDELRVMLPTGQFDLEDRLVLLHCSYRDRHPVLAILSIKDALDELSGDDVRRRPDAAYFTQVTC
ncbi:hypothetical protein [Tardiphaga sp. 619_E2_N8_5]|uniref:hypothetical protein n=1 Tax=unclassified Tardiphaga TaxID=2631404 RepID=UPI003F221F9F